VRKNKQTNEQTQNTVRKNYRRKKHAYVHKGVDLVSLRKFSVVRKY